MTTSSNVGFLFDLVCAFIFIATVPLILLYLFSPLMIKSLQKMQEKHNERVKIPGAPNKIRVWFRKHFPGKITCPRCGTKNDGDRDYCSQCGTRLRV